MHDTTETLHYTRVHTTRAQVWLCEQACNVIMILLKVCVNVADDFIKLFIEASEAPLKGNKDNRHQRRATRSTLYHNLI